MTSPNGLTKSEIDFLSDNRCIVQYVEVLGKVRSSDHRIVKDKIRLIIKRKVGKLAKSRKSNMESVRARMQ